MRAIAVAAFPGQHQIECDGLRELGAHAKLVIGAESMRKRDAVSPADDDSVRRQRALPDSTLDAGVDILCRIIGPERREEVRGGGQAQPVAGKRLARPNVERPPVRAGEVETRLVKRERRADTRRADQPRPRGAKRERVDRNHAARGIRAIDGLRDVTQTDAAVEQSQLSNRAGGNANRRDDARGIDCGGRLNRLQRELDPRAVLRLRRIPHDGGGTQGEGRRDRKRRRGNPPERRPRRLLSGRSRGSEQQQSNSQQANALHAERLLAAVAPSTQVNYLQPVTALGHTPLRLSELLTPDRIRVPLRAQSKEGVLRELVDLLVGGNGASDDVFQAILERERQSPTGIGYGVAVPHGKTPALTNLLAVAGTTRAPVPYETVDGEPVRLFFLLAGPESQAGAHVKALSRISRLVRREPIRARLLAASDAQEFYSILVEAEAGGGG